MQKYSKKRQSILDCLVGTKEHPSAEWIFSKLKYEYPSLSLATVYRNLTVLKEKGLIRSLGTVNGQERFDADITPHTHIVCIRCGKITDASDIVLPKELNESLENRTEFTVLRAELTVSGICGDCRKKEEQYIENKD